MALHNRIVDIREYLLHLYLDDKFVTDKTGAKVVEIIGASFIADDNTIFGVPNDEYIQREIAWYESQSLSVYDMPKGPPAIWQKVADKDGFINSNYGWCIFSDANGNQFDNALAELVANPESRRANMIYTRPSMWKDYNLNGRSDYICTNTVQYVVRDNRVSAIVQMRSNDGWAGYRNDFAWQKYVLDLFVKKLNIVANTSYECGTIYWNASSLHIYSSQFYLLEHYGKTGDYMITKENYDKRYLG